MKATKIKMYRGYEDSNSVQEIDEIYLVGSYVNGFEKKADVHDRLIKNPRSIQVDRSPYPDLLPKISSREQKYVASMPNDSVHDNLLKLPRE